MHSMRGIFSARQVPALCVALQGDTGDASVINMNTEGTHVVHVYTLTQDELMI
jgi:hypothetical protein